MILIFAGRPGSGKTTIVKELLSRFDDWVYVRAITTRQPRENDLVGQYEHTNEEDFDLREKAGEFLLPVKIHGYKSAIKKSAIEELGRSHASYGVIVLEPNSVKEFMGSAIDSVPIYVEGGDSKVLEARLLRRGDDESAVKEKLLESDSWDVEAHENNIPYLHVDNTGRIENTINQILKSLPVT